MIYPSHNLRREMIGSVGVDSGTLMVIDPCYTLNDDRDETGDSPYLRAAMPTCDAPFYNQCTEGGLVFSTLYGDGVYPVYADLNDKGRIVRIVVELDDPEYDEEDDYEDWEEDDDDTEDELDSFGVPV